MRIDFQDDASNLLEANIGKYVTLYHKWNFDRKNMTHSEDMCVARIVSVSRSRLLGLPSVKMEFVDGRKVDLAYISEFEGQLILHWDFKRVGRHYNDLFVTDRDGNWEYTFPDPKNKDAEVEYFLKTGDFFIKFHRSELESKDAILSYNDHLVQADEIREQERERAKAYEPINLATLQTETVQKGELDKLFRARA